MAHGVNSGVLSAQQKVVGTVAFHRPQIHLFFPNQAKQRIMQSKMLATTMKRRPSSKKDYSTYHNTMQPLCVRIPQKVYYIILSESFYTGIQQILTPRHILTYYGRTISNWFCIYCYIFTKPHRGRDLAFIKIRSTISVFLFSVKMTIPCPVSLVSILKQTIKIIF